MLPTWRARFIEQTLLRNQDKRTLRNFAAGDIAFGVCNFSDRSAEMDRPCSATCIRFPRNRRRERVIDFENSRCVLKIFQSMAITIWQPVARDSRELPDCRVKKRYSRFRQFIQILDAAVDVDL